MSGRVAIDLDGRGGLHDLALVHDADPVGQAHGLDLIMGDIDGGGLAFGQDALQFRPHFQSQKGIEVRQRLVHQDHVRLHRQGAGHGDALTLTARQFARIAFQQLFDMHQRCHAFDAAGDLGVRHLGHPQTEADVLEDRQMRKDGIILEDHRDATVLGGQVIDAAPADPDLSGRGGFQPGDDAQQRGLAAARCAQQDHEFLVRDGQVDVVQGLICPEGLGDILDLDFGH